MIVVLICYFFTLLQCQVSPVWEESPYMETKVVYIVDNHQKQSGTYTQNSTFTKPLQNAQVCLSIVQIKVVSYTNDLGFRNTISAFYSDRFTHLLEIFSPTEIWHLELRYLAYDGDVAHLSGIQVAFTNASMSTINSGSGSTRTESINPTITTVNTNNDIIYATFVTGFQARANDYYQANLTTSLASTTTLQVDITVAEDTEIDHMTIYYLVADLTDLAVESWTFVETGVMKATYGTQYTFFSPEAFFDDNYISGMRSFSMRDNIQFNITIDNITFDSSEASYYVDITYFNLFVRNCQSPYTYYNKVDGLCYTECPDTTYPVEAYLTCEACHYSCAICTQSDTCDTCPTNRQLDSSNQCSCIDYYYEYNQNCRACHHSCLTCVHSGQYYHCRSCDAAMLRTYNSTANTCPCDNGYEDVLVTRCKQICGDGLVMEDPCDDGNTDNGDGCSSTCTIEDYFTCDSSAPSNCYFVANLTMAIAKIEKQQFSNTAYIYVQFSPFISLMSQLTTENVGANVTLSSKSVYVEGSYVVLKGTYSSDIEDTYVRVDMNQSSSGYFSQFDPVNVTFVAQSNNGLPIVTYTSGHYTIAQRLNYGSFVVGWIAFAFAFVFCWFNWKQLGTQLYFTIQFSFMSYIALSSFTPYMVGAGQAKYLMGYNDIAGQQTSTDLNRRVMEHMGYSVPFQYNFNLMVIIQGFALIMYGIYRLGLRYHQKKQEEDYNIGNFTVTYYGKFLSLFKFDFFCYWAFFNMNQILIGTVLQGEDITTNPGIFAYVVLCLIFVLVAIVAVFAKPKSLEAYRQILFHSGYGNRTFLFVLIGMVLMDAFLLMAVLLQVWVYYCTLAVPVVLIVYTGVRRPFKSHWNNGRLILLLLSLLTVQILIILMINLPQDDTIHYPIGILSCICFSIFMTLIVWIIMVVFFCKKHFTSSDKEKDDQSNYSSQKEEIIMKKKMRQANYSYHLGNQKSTLRNPIYEVTQAPNTGRKTKASFLTPRQTKSMVKKREEPKDFELAEMKRSSNKTDYFKSKKKLKELEEEQSERPIIANEGVRESGLKETGMDQIKTVTNKRRNRNLYEDILKSHI